MLRPVDPEPHDHAGGGARALLPERHESLHRRARAADSGERLEGVLRVVGKRPERLVVVDLGEDQVVGRRAHRHRHDPLIVERDREIRVFTVGARLGTQPARQPEDQVVLGLARAEEFAGLREERVRVLVPLDAHGAMSSR